MPELSVPVPRSEHAGRLLLPCCSYSRIRAWSRLRHVVPGATRLRLRALLLWSRASFSLLRLRPQRLPALIAAPIVCPEAAGQPSALPALASGIDWNSVTAAVAWPPSWSEVVPANGHNRRRAVAPD